MVAALERLDKRIDEVVVEVRLHEHTQELVAVALDVYGGDDDVVVVVVVMVSLNRHCVMEEEVAVAYMSHMEVVEVVMQVVEESNTGNSCF